MEIDKTGQKSPVDVMRSVKNLALVGAICTLPAALIVLVVRDGLYALVGFSFPGYGFWSAIALLRVLAILSTPVLGFINMWLGFKTAKRSGILMLISGLAGVVALLTGLLLESVEALVGGNLDLLFLSNRFVFPFLLAGTTLFIIGGIKAIRVWRNSQRLSLDITARPDSQEGETRSAAVIFPKAGAAEAKDAISSKSRLAAMLSCFFLGWLGVHRFYIGKNLTAGIQAGLGIFGTWSGVGATLQEPQYFPIHLIMVGGPFLVPLFFWVLIDLLSLIVGSMRDKEGRFIERW